MKPPKTIAVHNGKFHPDDVIAIAVLKLIFPKVKIIRTRDPTVFEKADMRVDVCGRYDSAKGDFDHHQKEGAGKRKNGIPYASAGLIWRHFGKQLTKRDEVWQLIDEGIMQYVDADDTGIQTYTPEKLDPYKIRDIVLNYNPVWTNESDALYDARFFEMVGMFEKILIVEIERCESKVLGEKLVLEEVKKLPSHAQYIVFERHLPWKQVVVEKTNLLFAVVHNPVENNWAVLAIPKTKTSLFDNRKYLPKTWGGLTGEALQNVTGVSDAVFCHNKLFCAIAKSKEGAIALVEQALAA